VLLIRPTLAIGSATVLDPVVANHDGQRSRAPDRRQRQHPDAERSRAVQEPVEGD
jgi:hypothetical protein